MNKFWPFIERHWFLTTLFVVMLIIFLWYEHHIKQRERGAVTPQIAVNLINKQHASIIDLRSEDAFKAGHIVRSQRVDLKALSAYLNKIPKAKKKPVIVVADVLSQVASAKKILAKAGFDDVVSIRGGLKAWKDAGLPLEKEGVRS